MRRAAEEAEVMVDAAEIVKAVYCVWISARKNANAFDGNPFTLVRTVVDNPFVITLLPEPRR